MASCPALGQEVQKKTVTQADYHLWHKARTDKVSDDGKWVSYQLLYQTADTLFVQHTRSGKTFVFPQGRSSSMAKGQFACKGSNNDLYWLNLETARIRKFQHVKSYHLLDHGLLVLEQGSAYNTLRQYDVKGKEVMAFEKVSTFSLSPDGKKAAVVTAGFQVLIYPLITRRPMLLHQNTDLAYQNLAWSKDGSSLAFVSGTEYQGTLFYHNQTQGLQRLDYSEGTFADNRTLQRDRDLMISDDNERVIFTVQKEDTAPDGKTGVEVWNSADKWVYPAAQAIKGWRIVPMQAMWTPGTGKLMEINTTALPWGGAVGPLDYALTYNPQRYEPQIKSEADRDIYLTDLETGKRELLLEKQDGNGFHFMASRDGKYLSYFRKGKWMAYDIRSKLHIPVSDGIPYALSELSDQTEDYIAFRSPGWLEGRSSMLVYDQYDLWQVFLDGQAPVRLTDGREQGIVYRIVPQGRSERTGTENQVTMAGMFDSNKPMLLAATSADYRTTGYFSLSNKTLTKICYEDRKTSNVVQSPDRKTTVWMQESFESPPQVCIRSGGSTKPLVQTNRHQKDYLWGRVETVHYLSGAGNPIRGLLYYPAGFTAGRKYPMVVGIYQTQYKKIHHYHKPVQQNGTGFNIANLVSKGYFVFLPDIVYDLENVGDAAVRCVENGVLKVLQAGDVDPGKVGLNGHSFGGYQTNFIVTKSKMFACAVAGAADCDLISGSHVLDKNVNMPSFFKTELGQFRIRNSIAGRTAYYIYNSPIFFAGDITTPLLAWTGKEDTQVEPSQSFEFYMALRRLGKPHVLLAYPDEGHEIMAPQNAADLTTRVEGWFDHHLKGGPQLEWMESK